MADKPVFSFGELLVLLDVEGVGAMSAPIPTPVEASELTKTPLHGTAPCVELHGACRFRKGLAHLFDPPRADLVVSPAHVMLSITRFPDDDIWTNMFEWVNGYLADTLTPTPQSTARDGYCEYTGQGVIATLGYTRPNVRLDSRDLVIEVALRRDETTLATVRPCSGSQVMRRSHLRTTGTGASCQPFGPCTSSARATEIPCGSGSARRTTTATARQRICARNGAGDGSTSARVRGSGTTIGTRSRGI